MAHDTDTADTSAARRATTVLVVGASGSIGRHVVDRALRARFETRALVRDPAQDSLFPQGTQVVVGDPTAPATLGDALDRVDAVVFTQGTYRDADAEQVNYRPVATVLGALTAPARVALMTTVGVTKPTPGHDWKRRGERLVRASGLPYTIVRPGWFDYNEDDEHHLVFRQGDTHWAGNPSDGVISRAQIADVLIASLTSEAADGKTLELVAEQGQAQADLEPLFAALQPDDGPDGPGDRDTLPLDEEPVEVVAEIDALRGRF